MHVLRVFGLGLLIASISIVCGQAAHSRSSAGDGCGSHCLPGQAAPLEASAQVPKAASLKLKLALDADDKSSEPAKTDCDSAEVRVGDQCIKPGSGKSFRDCANCPEMVVVPAGSFMMGSPEDEEGHSTNESPQLKITIKQPFAVGKYAVTFAEWEACVADGGCGGYKPADEGWGRDDRPLVNVSWDDAQLYIKWLSEKSGKTYRLLSEAEWEYAARAGTTTPFWWGSSITPKQANYDSYYAYGPAGVKGEYERSTVPVSSFQPNPWGLYQVHGNVWQWTLDCWSESNDGAAADGSARTTGDCTNRVIRGGAWDYSPIVLRSATRYWNPQDYRAFDVGFRLARILKP